MAGGGARHEAARIECITGVSASPPARKARRSRGAVPGSRFETARGGRFDGMLIYQWSASPHADAWDDARRLVHEFAEFAETSLDWPPGVVMIGRGKQTPPMLTAEFTFGSAPDFEAAWQRLVDHDEAPTLWERLHPLLDEASVRRDVYDVPYIRARSAER